MKVTDSGIKTIFENLHYSDRQENQKLKGWNLKGYNSPLDTKYHAETDESIFLVWEDIPKYRMMVGSINWLVTLE